MVSNRDILFWGRLSRDARQAVLPKTLLVTSFFGAGCQEMCGRLFTPDVTGCHYPVVSPKQSQRLLLKRKGNLTQAASARLPGH
jgi:hypothetical protein